MKYKVLIALFLLGAVLVITGALFKLMHWPYGSFILTFALGIQGLSILLLIIKLLRNKDTKNILNR